MEVNYELVKFEDEDKISILKGQLISSSTVAGISIVRDIEILVFKCCENCLKCEKYNPNQK